MKNLQTKISQNNQRRKIEKLQIELPKQFNSFIDFNDFEYYEVIYEKHKLDLYPKGLDGNLVYPKDYSFYSYCETDNLIDLNKSILKDELHFNQDCYVKFGADNPYLKIKNRFIADLFNCYVEHLKVKFMHIKIFQIDFKKGYIVDEYCGYLPKPTENCENETVYENINWKM